MNNKLCERERVLNSTDMLELGRSLFLLRNPGVTLASTILSEIQTLRRLLKALSLNRALVTAQPLFNISSITMIIATGRPNKMAIAQIQSYMQPIAATVYSEFSELRVERAAHHQAVIEFSSVASILNLNGTQSALLGEAMQSFSVGSFRSCMVMTWNAVYDFMRQWVFDNRQADFNNSLTTQYLKKNGNPVYSAIFNYNDYMSGKPSERTVVDTWYSASIVSERVRDDLRQSLRRRNDCAHSTLKIPDHTQASSFARDLLDIAKGQPFA